MQRTRQYYLDEYVKNERSFKDIADEHNTYPNKIRREVIDFLIQPRNKSEAQLAALKSGRHNHPTKGVARSDEVRHKISQTLSDKWDSFSDKQKMDKSEKGLQIWASLSEEKKKRISGNARVGLTNSRKNGSKLEIFINAELIKHGYIPRLHVAVDDGLYKNDITLEKEKIIIDVCGPTHFIPIFGEENLVKKQAIDNLKAKIAMDNGYIFIRVISMTTTLSDLDKETLKHILLQKIKDFKENIPLIGERLIHLEIN